MADASVTTAPAIAATVRRLAPGIALSAAVAVAAVLGAPWVAGGRPDPGDGDRAAHRHRAQCGWRRGSCFSPAWCSASRRCCAGRWRCSACASRSATSSRSASRTALVVVVAMVGDDRGRLPARARCSAARRPMARSPAPAPPCAAPPRRSRPRRCCRTITARTPTSPSSWSPSTRSRPSRWCSIRRSASGSASTPHATGVMLGATIHDVAQVVGAGYAVSEPVGNTAVIVKLFRVFLLLPVVLGDRLVVRARRRRRGAAKVPVPVFALVFLGALRRQQRDAVAAGARAGLRADQGRAGRGLDLGPADRHRGARARHLDRRPIRGARLAARRDRHRHDPRHPRGRDGRPACSCGEVPMPTLTLAEAEDLVAARADALPHRRQTNAQRRRARARRRRGRRAQGPRPLARAELRGAGQGRQGRRLRDAGRRRGRGPGVLAVDAAHGFAYPALDPRVALLPAAGARSRASRRRRSAARIIAAPPDIRSSASRRPGWSR